MTSSLTAEHVLEDIEFELAQGAISRDDLGRSIHAVRQYQSKLRVELLAPGRKEPDWREALGRQLQLNDMLLTLLQETAASVREFQLQLRRTNYLAPRVSSSAAARPPATATPTLTSDQWRDTSELREAAAVKLEPALDVRPVSVPLLGPLLQRFRYALHNLVVFYLRRLGREQRAVNHTFADWHGYQEALHRHLAEEHDRLAARVVELEQRLAAIEKSQIDE